jgi:RNA polymerase sigma factor (sigma-70 family)
MEDKLKGDPIVYVVDDDADVREGLASLLQSVGLATKVFSSAAEFLQSKIPDEPACLISDVRMPGLSGLDFQEELTKAQIDIPIIFISGHGDIPMTVKAIKAGAVQFLTKPIREQDLLDAVRDALARDHERREQIKKSHALRDRFNALSPREQQVMQLVCMGLMNKQTAAQIGVSEITVKVHRHNLMKKLGAKSLPDLVRMADMLGIPRIKDPP